MKIQEFVDRWEEKVPLFLQMEGDNCGRQWGRFGRELTGIVLSLDLTQEAVDLALAKGANLIFTHHPYIWNPLRSFTDDEEYGHLILQTIEENIAVYASHTAFDAVDGGVNDELAKRLGLRDQRPLLVEEDPMKAEFSAGMGVIGQVDECNLADFAQVVKEALGAGHVLYYGFPDQPIGQVAVLGGSGAFMMDQAKAQGAQVLVTSDLKHDHALREKDLAVIDAGHYWTENPSLDAMERMIAGIDPEIAVVKASHEPWRLRRSL